MPGSSLNKTLSSWKSMTILLFLMSWIDKRGAVSLPFLSITCMSSEVPANKPDVTGCLARLSAPSELPSANRKLRSDGRISSLPGSCSSNLCWYILWAASSEEIVHVAQQSRIAHSSGSLKLLAASSS